MIKALKKTDSTAPKPAKKDDEKSDGATASSAKKETEAAQPAKAGSAPAGQVANPWPGAAPKAPNDSGVNPVWW